MNAVYYHDVLTDRALREVINPNTNRYYITTKLILPKEQNAFIKEIGHIHNCTLVQKWYNSSSDFETINVVYSFCHSFRYILQCFKNK